MVIKHIYMVFTILACVGCGSPSGNTGDDAVPEPKQDIHASFIIEF